MIAVLLDQGLAPRAAAILRANGISAVPVSEIGMERAQDIQILDTARKEGQVCMTRWTTTFICTLH